MTTTEIATLTRVDILSRNGCAPYRACQSIASLPQCAPQLSSFDTEALLALNCEMH